MNDSEMRDMLIEYMGKGFLENISAMMRQEPTAVRFIPDLLGDDSLMVRLGTTALVEDLATTHRTTLTAAVPGLIALLGHENPTIRGDAANVLGIIGDRSALPALKKLLDDGNPSVREITAESVKDLEAVRG